MCAPAAAWFGELRDRLIAAFEAIEDEQGREQEPEQEPEQKKEQARGDPPARFVRTPWERADGGGGTMAVLRGRVLEKAGVNVSVVGGTFPEPFRQRIPGAGADGRFWAAGVSVVVHPRSPMVPTAHMNTRMIVTSRRWFGGGADLTPTFAFDEDTRDFHAALAAACDAADADYYARFKAWCDTYFFLAHRNEPRGVGGIFFDDLNSGDPDADFAFVRATGLAFLDIYPRLIRRRMALPWTEEQKHAQRVKRGRYVEFNLLWDRGTRFGIETGGNPEAVLMSLPPEAAWP